MSNIRGRNDRPSVTLPTPGINEMLVIPLGGTDRVGMNATLVGFDRKWIMIDAGATFPGGDSDRAAELGAAFDGEVQQIVPDLRVIRGLMSRLAGIVVTHAHEDHIGALPTFFSYMKAWPELSRVPIYATNYTRGIIRRKLEEIGQRPKIVCIQPRRNVRIGSLDVLPVSVTHSAPETLMLAIRSAAGTIVFGSDAKLDPSPVLGRRTDTEALEILGRAGVTCYMGDSTNAIHDGRSVSEAQVVQGLTSIMRRHPGRVVVSTFASNLARIVGVTQAAKAAGRELGGAGRSILNNVETAVQCGLLTADRVNFLEHRYLNEAPVGHSAVVCTGTQAEQGSALRRAAEDLEMGRNNGRGLRLEAGDLVVHSARTIPGNEGAVDAMFEMLRNAGVQVMTPGDTKEVIHASGHAKRGELSDMYQMLRPRFAAPVHGDRNLIGAHVDLAKSAGVGTVISPREGEVLAISDAGMRIAGRIPVAELAVLSVNGKYSGETRLVPWRAPSINLSFRSPDNSSRRQVRRPTESTSVGMRPAMA